MSEAETADSGYANQEFVDETADQLQRERQETREQREESSAFKRKLQNAREKNTVALEIWGADFEFYVVKGSVTDDIMDTAEEFQRLSEVADDEDWSDEEQDEKAKEYIDDLAEILKEHYTGDSTKEEWREELGRSGVARKAALLVRKSEQAGMSDEELEAFRDE